MLDRAGAFYHVPAGVMVLSAVWIRRNLASGRLAPLCPERDQLREECRNAGLAIAKPRPGWDVSPPRSGGTRELL
jgi:hypothetical protein